jgi:hypothetical protein
MSNLEAEHHAKRSLVTAIRDAVCGALFMVGKLHPFLELAYRLMIVDKPFLTGIYHQETQYNESQCFTP